MEVKMKKEIGKEIAVVVGASVFLGFLLALHFRYPIISIEPHDFLISFLLALLMLGVFVGAQKFAAYRLDCKTKTKLLGFRRYGLKAWMQFTYDFPLWIVLPIVLFFITNGFFKWLAILDFDVDPLSRKVRRKWAALSEDDVGKIAIAGPLAVLAMGIISKIIALGTGIASFSSFAFICALLCVVALIPIGLGFKMMMSSRVAWFFTIIFSFCIMLLMKLQNVFSIVFIALLFAAAATIAYYTLYEK
jgi:hypothetical protein